jgi:hypothetical protein
MKKILAELSIKTAWGPLLCLGVALSCSPTILPSTPPENYQGPVAEAPALQTGDYWVYERGNAQKVKAGAGTVMHNMGFPLWIGKTWVYDIGAHRAGLPPSATQSKIPGWVECSVLSFNQVQVQGGQFGAFICECQCRILGGGGFYQEGCGTSTIWYAPDVKNIVKMKTDSTATSFELVEYRLSGRISDERRKADNEKKTIGQTDKAEIPAKPIRAIPEDGSENVPASLKEIVIVFDQPMSNSWSLSCSPSFYPNAAAGSRCSEAGVYWRDDRTFVVPLTAGLKPNQRYSFTVNPSVGLEKSNPARAFRGLGQPKPVAPQRFFFTAGP